MTILMLGRGKTVGATADPALDRRVLAAWAAMFLNVLPFSALPSCSQCRAWSDSWSCGGTGARLPARLAANPRGLLRANVYVVLLSALCLVALIVSFHNTFLMGSTYGAIRFAGFVGVLWLLSPCWARRDLAPVALPPGLPADPVALGRAGRSRGARQGLRLPGPAGGRDLADLPYGGGALRLGAAGMTCGLWICRVISGRNAALTLALTAAVLLATHTRTALLAGPSGSSVRRPACCSLAPGRGGHGCGVARGDGRGGGVRVRADVLALAGTDHRRGGGADRTNHRVVGLSWPIRARSSRTSSGRACPTCRSTGWPSTATGSAPISISDSWGSVSRSSSWWCCSLTALTRPSGPGRAVAIFMVVYCIFSSITETGLSGPSPYLLDLAVASAVLLRPHRRRRPMNEPEESPESQRLTDSEKSLTLNVAGLPSVETTSNPKQIWPSVTSVSQPAAGDQPVEHPLDGECAVGQSGASARRRCSRCRRWPRPSTGRPLNLRVADDRSRRAPGWKLSVQIITSCSPGTPLSQMSYAAL